MFKILEMLGPQSVEQLQFVTNKDATKYIEKFCKHIISGKISNLIMSEEKHL